MFWSHQFYLIWLYLPLTLLFDNSFTENIIDINRPLKSLIKYSSKADCIQWGRGLTIVLSSLTHCVLAIVSIKSDYSLPGIVSVGLHRMLITVISLWWQSSINFFPWKIFHIEHIHPGRIRHGWESPDTSAGSGWR